MKNAKIRMENRHGDILDINPEGRVEYWDGSADEIFHENYKDFESAKETFLDKGFVIIAEW